MKIVANIDPAQADYLVRILRDKSRFLAIQAKKTAHMAAMCGSECEREDWVRRSRTFAHEEAACRALADGIKGAT